MARSLPLNMFAAVTQTLVQTFVLFFLYRYIIDILGVEMLGVWSIVLASVAVSRVGELGLSASVTRFVADYRARQDQVAVREIVSTAATTLTVVLGVGLALLYPVLTWALGYFLPASHLVQGQRVLPQALLSLWLMTIGGVWMGGLDGCLRSDLRALLTIVSTLIYFCAAVVLVRKLGLYGLALAQVIQSGLLATLGWVLLRRVLGCNGSPFGWHGQRFREMFSYGVNFQINSVVMLLFEPITKMLLGRYGELAIAGYFELAQRLVIRVRSLIIEANRVIVPVVAGIQSTGQPEDTRMLYANNARYLFYVVTPMFFMLVGLMPIISALWIGESVGIFVAMASVLAIAWYLNSLGAPAYFFFLGSGRLKWVTCSHVAMGGLNLVLGWLLGRTHGWTGVIAAFCISLCVGSLIPVLAYHRQLKIGFRDIYSRHDGLLLLCCASVCVVAFLVFPDLLARGMGRIQAAALVGTGAGLLTVLVCLLHPLTGRVLRATVNRLGIRSAH